MHALSDRRAQDEADASAQGIESLRALTGLTWYRFAIDVGIEYRELCRLRRGRDGGRRPSYRHMTKLLAFARKQEGGLESLLDPIEAMSPAPLRRGQARSKLGPVVASASA